MDEAQNQPFSTFAHRHRHTVESVVTLLEWLLVAFILALLFQGFAMQAFQIPTGSMAETLRGDHFPIRCTRCGFAFDVGSDRLSINRAQCPNCDYTMLPQDVGAMKNGDRIFVLKSIYQFFEPRRWDVVVFKNPTNPKDNFIKRLIGLPGEMVQLIGGDVYIDGKIVRKPPRVQNELWMPIYVQDHLRLGAPRSSQENSGPPKRLPDAGFDNENGSRWEISDAVCSLKDGSADVHSMIYRTDNPHDFKAIYSYNDSSDYMLRPTVGDLMISFYVNSDRSGMFGASLESGGVLYAARVEQNGAMVFEKIENGQLDELRRTLINVPVSNGFKHFEFAVVDRQLVLYWAGQRAVYDLTKEPDFVPGANKTDRAPAVHIFASGRTELRHIGLYRDIYYLGTENDQARRATQDKPFKLREGQFFVCGDNSNDSHDSRSWEIRGIGNNGATFDMGVVPMEYMMGKAVMVYWAQAFCPTPTMPAMVPNFNNLKVIYGSSRQEY